MYTGCMTSTLLTLSSIGFITLTALVIAGWKKAAHSLPLLGLFLAVYLIDNLILVLVNLYPQLQVIPNTTWGTLLCVWSGKLYSILIALLIAVLVARAISPAEFGLKLAQPKGSISPVLISLLLAGLVAAILGLGFDKGPFDPLVLIYLAIMPGLNEELTYRGLLLGIANRISHPRWTFLQARFGWGALITSLLFGLLHGFWIDDGFIFHFNAIVVFFNSLAGLVYAWQRERTGSLLFPVLTHGAIDFFIVFVRMV